LKETAVHKVLSSFLIISGRIVGMKTVVLDGVQYTKSTTLAEEFGYTSDYLGQLCRAKKVDARLVGRTWFVNPDSLHEHKEGAQQKPSTTDDLKVKSRPADTASNVKIHRINVDAPLKNKTVKLVTKNARVEWGPADSDTKMVHHQSISYDRDTENLMPSLSKSTDEREPDDSSENITSQSKKYLRVEPALAKKLKIKTIKKKQTSFKSTELPDVALSGKLAINTYDAQVEPQKPVVAHTPAEPAPNQTETSKPPKKRKIVKPASQISSQDINLKNVRSKHRIHPSKSNSTSLLMRLLPLGVTLLAVGVAVVLLSVASEISVSESLSRSSLSVQLSKFFELFAQ